MEKNKAISPARPERDSDSSKEGSKDRVSNAAALGPSSLKSKIISVAVGGQTEPFLIHQDILCASSPFFRNACNGGWKESEEGFVTLPSHSPETFEVYVQWLYFGNMFVEDQKDDYENLDWDIFIDAYILGDKLLDVDFRNALIDLAIRVEVHFDQIPHNHAKAAYSGLPESDPYCRLYVDMHTWEIASSWYSDVNNKDATDAPMEFFRDVAKTAAENRKSIGSSEDGPWVTDPGRYHHRHPSS
ncbi:BTB/POZ domain containing protein [Neofusicoccum parvum]|uniref:BTB/POZ domain containing protein n=1 Tax=Neofusicoccum parvum TaxID=310453 RepID=A0ACB5SD17_9PEZI|nr:BTB/POZ domain containing protein [Neofusicoccum parvum]